MLCCGPPAKTAERPLHRIYNFGLRPNTSLKVKLAYLKNILDYSDVHYKLHYTTVYNCTVAAIWSKPVTSQVYSMYRCTVLYTALYSTVESVPAATLGEVFSVGLSARESTRLGEGGIFITELNSATHFLVNISDAFPK